MTDGERIREVYRSYEEEVATGSGTCAIEASRG